MLFVFDKVAKKKSSQLSFIVKKKIHHIHPNTLTGFLVEDPALCQKMEIEQDTIFSQNRQKSLPLGSFILEEMVVGAKKTESKEDKQANTENSRWW